MGDYLFRAKNQTECSVYQCCSFASSSRPPTKIKPATGRKQKGARTGSFVVSKATATHLHQRRPFDAPPRTGRLKLTRDLLESCWRLLQNRFLPPCCSTSSYSLQGFRPEQRDQRARTPLSPFLERKSDFFHFICETNEPTHSTRTNPTLAPRLNGESRGVPPRTPAMPRWRCARSSSHWSDGIWRGSRVVLQSPSSGLPSRS